MYKIKTILSIIFCLGTFITKAQLSPNSHPNIIYILADDLGIGDLSIYNENSKILTPHLDKLGKQGMVFTDAHTSSSVCTPTRYGILTGRYNWRTPLKQFVTWGNSPMLIRDDRLTVADLLQQHGYKTANIGKWHLGLNWAMKDGSQEFEYYSGSTDRVDFSQIDYSKPLKKGALDLGFDYSYLLAASLNMPPYVYIENDKAVKEPITISEQKRADDPYAHWIKGDISEDFKHEEVLPVFIEKAKSYINENANGDKPFFLYLPLPAPHNPILPLDKWKGKSNLNPYADFVVMIDDLMGELFKTIKDKGIEENTLVIFTSDNGCAGTANIPLLKSKGHNPSYIYSGAKGSYLEGGHRVPFLVKWPQKIKANSVCNKTVCTTDFMATCADIVAYKVKDNEGEDSYSMMPLFYQIEGYAREATIHHNIKGIFAIRKGDWKLIVSPNSGVNADGKPEQLKKKLPENILFNLKTDIGEKENVAEKYPEKVHELKQLLIKQIKDGRSTPGKPQENYPASRPWTQAEFAFELPIFSIKDFGAVGDGLTLNTNAFQQTIDACYKAGGGTVWIPAGDYVIGTIQLKSNITLSLDYGATLLGSQEHKDYPIDNLRPAREGNSECLLYAEDATNIRMEGLGTIDGRGTPEAFPKRAGPGGKDNRPRLIRFENCKNVTFSGLKYRRPAFWGLHLIDCYNVHINGVDIDFRNNGSNNDGLDIDGCEEVLIENCNINSGDDAICLKSSLNPCKNFVVRNCRVSSHTAPLKFGTSSSGGFINVKVENCYFYDCPMGAIKLQIVDGGTMENIDISRIKVVNGGSPVFIRLANRGRIYTQNTYTGTNKINGEKSEGASVGSIKNIRIRDVVAEVTFADRNMDRNAKYKKVKYPSEEKTEREKAQAGPIMIAGIPGHYIENVRLENISISYPGGGTEAAAKAIVPEDITRYPEQYFFGVLPAWGAYIRHAINVQFKNVKMTTRNTDKREMIVLDDVEGFVNQ